MKIQEIKNVESGELMFSVVEPENDLDLKVMEYIARLLLSLEHQANPEKMKDFHGKIILNVVDDKIIPTFLHVVQDSVKAEELIDKLEQAEKDKERLKELEEER